MKLRIVPMTARHLSAVAELERVCFPADPWSEALYRAALDNPAVAVLLALGEDGALLGYAVLSTVLDEGNLDNIAVARPARRRARLACLMLEVRASNGPAIALYEKHGFRAVGRRKNYYDAPREDAILMTLKFGPDTGRTMCAPTDGGSYETAPAEQRGACRPL